MPNPVFGDWEGAAIAADSRLIPVPVGSQCPICKELIQPGDVGMRMGHIGADRETAVAEDWHRECLYFVTIGHDVGVCTCTDWPASRASAREAWSRRRQL